jgi:hypothetical protein
MHMLTFCLLLCSLDKYSYAQNKYNLFKERKKLYVIVSVTERGHVESHSKTTGYVKIFFEIKGYPKFY